MENGLSNRDNAHLLQNYEFYRACGYKASAALYRAKSDVAVGKLLYPASQAIGYNPRHDAHGYKQCAWIENVGRGLRGVGYADEILSRLRHKGWYTDDTQSDVYRGIVYQLPGRDGKSLYVYGYADPMNRGAAFLCFDYVDDKEDAARFADRLAEIFAEEEREYQEAWRAGRDYVDLEEEIKKVRAAALALAKERHTAKGSGYPTPMICATIRKTVLEAYQSIQTMREERETLFNDFGRHPGFVE